MAADPATAFPRWAFLAGSPKAADGTVLDLNGIVSGSERLLRRVPGEDVTRPSSSR